MKSKMQKEFLREILEKKTTKIWIEYTKFTMLKNTKWRNSVVFKRTNFTFALLLLEILMEKAGE
jgi:hypothetical protein